MPPKKSKKFKATVPEANESEKNALSNMFKKIESKDSVLKECKYCNQRIKSCLLSDHINTKCPNRKLIESKQNQVLTNMNNDIEDDEEIIFISSNTQSFNEHLGNNTKKEERSMNLESSPNPMNKNLLVCPQVIKEEAIIYDIKPKIEIEDEPDEKKFKPSDSICADENSTKNDIKTYNQPDDDNNEDDMLLFNHCESFENNPQDSSFKIQNVLQTSNHEEKISSPKKNNDFEYNLNNFENAMNLVINQENFSHLLNDYDREIINKFSGLSSKCLFSL